MTTIAKTATPLQKEDAQKFATDLLDYMRRTDPFTLLGELEASGFTYGVTETGRSQLIFAAKIRPYKKDGGKSSRRAAMTVKITHTPQDYLKLEAVRADSTVHAVIEDVEVSFLPALLAELASMD